jgi:WS/DGAT/MGAT family acyltransferase
LADQLLSPIDSTFWHLESADHPMHLGALAVLEPPSRAGRDGGRRIAEAVAERTAAMPRLRRRVQDVWYPPGALAWSEDPDFDVHRHVQRIALDDTAGVAQRDEIVAELMARPLDRGRPPWAAYVLAGRRGGPVHVLLKLHHALADGLGAVEIGAGLMDQVQGLVPAPRRPSAPVQPAARAADGSLSALAGDLVGGLVRTADPRALPERLREAGRRLGIGAAVLRTALEGGGDPVLAAPTSGTRALATAELDLDDITRIRKSVRGTANDVLIAVVAGALRRWLLASGADSATLASASPRALIPVSRRRRRRGADGDGGSGNVLSGYLVRLPIAQPDPLSRLQTVRTAMDRCKAVGTYGGAGAVALLAEPLPPALRRAGAPLAGRSARLLFDLLLTSVPLPDIPLSLGGASLRALHPLAPLARGHGFAVAMSVYRGRVHVGVLADGQVLRDPSLLREALSAEVAELVAAVR